jgi:lipopolysaccharide transport system ATP-binding protein
MSDVVIRVENLSKMFIIGPEKTSTTPGGYTPGQLARKLMPMLLGFPPREENDFLWALRDINFDVRTGEIVGIVGGNGSGKSTLLKVLSRITQPTKGSFSITGRVGSLLEVGTGFHPDLTGRQNIYLNGSILGMSSEEIARRFDEIVDFAEIEKFLDTPVRHYSSGMYMRLAFSVSSHLDCDILLVDEVLAVGDLKFQRKCLGTMKDRLGSGRTVLFVSHSTSAILQICTRALWLDQGKLISDDTPHHVIEKYVDEQIDVKGERVWSEAAAPAFEDGTVRLRALRIRDAGGLIRASFDLKEEFEVEMEFDVVRQVHPINLHLYFAHDVAGKLFVSMDNLESPLQDKPPAPGRYSARCHIPADFLNEGMFTIEAVICTFPTTTYHLAFRDAVIFSITDDMKSTGVRGNWEREWPPAAVRPRMRWRHALLSQSP